MDFPLDFKRGLKAIWAAAQGTKPSLGVREHVQLKNPLKNQDPLCEVLRHLALKSMGHIAPPLIPRITPLPIAELCQLVLLWSIAKETAAAAELAYSIPLDFPWLWSRESDYEDEKTIASLALLKKAIACEEPSITCEGDPYFQALANHLCCLDSPSSSIRSLDWSLFQTQGIQCALTFSGDGTSLGAALSNSVEIRAFGPQTHPLSDPVTFGIRPIAQHGNRWASPIGNPEIWFETKTEIGNDALFFDLSFFGLSPSKPLNFSFYIKADSAQVGNEKFKPNTLHRYQGEAKPVALGEKLKVESQTPGKMEVIPLAGSGAFWNCEYLVSFEIHAIISKFSFSISNIT